MEDPYGFDRPITPPSDVPLRDVIEALLEHAPEGVLVADGQGRISMANAMAEEAFGYGPGQLVGRPVQVLLPGGLPILPPGAEAEFEATGLHKDGRQIPLRIGITYPHDVDGVAATAFIRPLRVPAAPPDPETRAASGAAAEPFPLKDPLTGLPGRTIFMDRLSVALAHTSRRTNQVAVLLLDLDGFRLINDSYGKGTGDTILRTFAERLFGALRPGDTVARIGEDEFAILCDDIARSEGAATIAERVHGAVSSPFAIDADELEITAGLGGAVGSSRDHSPESLFHRAEEALRSAKGRGRGQMEFARGVEGPSHAVATAGPDPVASSGGAPEATEDAGAEAAGAEVGVEEAAPPGPEDPQPVTVAAEAASTGTQVGETVPIRVEVVPVDDSAPGAAAENDAGSALVRAVERGEFRLWYQPIVRLASGRIAGVEALLRWDDPERGIRSPAEFMPLAEESGLMVRIGTWVLRQAIGDAKRLQAASRSGAPLMLSVNLSARQLADPAFVDVVRGILVGSTIDPGTLYLEIGESDAMEHVDAISEVLRDLRSTGVRMTIDDFGTGFSSLAHLNRFPIDFLKVDRSFVKGLDTPGGASNVVTAVISVAHALGMPAIAEGVESELQLTALRGLRCDYAQGYLFARPATLEDVVALLDRDPTW